MSPYVEPGASWRLLWSAAALLAAGVALDGVLRGPGTAPVAWLAVTGLVLGTCLVVTVSARRAWTVRVDDGGLAVGREHVLLAEIDAGHLASTDSGVDAGAPLLGGGWSLPKGRTGLPLRLADGRTVLVATRDPAALRAAVLSRRGTLGT